MLNRLIQWFKNLFTKDSSTPAPIITPTSAPVQSVPTAKVLSLDTREGWEAFRNSLVPSTRAFTDTWEQKVEKDKRIAENQGPAVDRSGFILNAENGWLVTPLMADGQPHMFIAGKAGTIRVFGVGGNQLRKVNGQPVIREAEIPGQKVGLFTLSVESVDGRVGVQIV